MPAIQGAQCKPDIMPTSIVLIGGMRQIPARPIHRHEMMRAFSIIVLWLQVKYLSGQVSCAKGARIATVSG